MLNVLESENEDSSEDTVFLTRCSGRIRQLELPPRTGSLGERISAFCFAIPRLPTKIPSSGNSIDQLKEGRNPKIRTFQRCLKIGVKMAVLKSQRVQLFISSKQPSIHTLCSPSTPPTAVLVRYKRALGYAVRSARFTSEIKDRSPH